MIGNPEHTSEDRERLDRMRAEVADGLARDPKRLPPKFFYDERGSRLFEAITQLPEYYPTRTERALLERCVPGWVARLRPRAFVELGSGVSDKSRVILDVMAVGSGSVYVPIDVDAATLAETGRRLEREYPGLEIRPVVADITAALELPPDLPGPVLFGFLGSTIGNFERPAAIELLRTIADAMSARDRLLLGADLQKDVGILEAAYNDSAGVTAEFNLNMLNVLNAELGADFDPSGFEHRAFYSAENARIEMHLVSTRDQTVTIPRVGTFEIRNGESIRTEISCKYDRDGLAAMLEAAGLRMTDWQTDPDDLFALVPAEVMEGKFD